MPGSSSWFGLLFPQEHLFLVIPGCSMQGFPRVSRQQLAIDNAGTKKGLPAYFEMAWNTEACGRGRMCADAHCQKFHYVTERRCKGHALPDCTCTNIQPCPLGLHISIDSIKEILEIEIDDMRACHENLETLKTLTHDERAVCVRMVIWGLGGPFRCTVLKWFLDWLPLLHELVLPDWKEEAQLMDFLRKDLGQRARENPRLRDVIFMDGTCEPLW